MPIKLSMKANEMRKSGKEVDSCPDSGATVTIINKDFAKEHKLKWKKSKVTLTSATGAKMKVSGELVLFAKERLCQKAESRCEPRSG